MVIMESMAHGVIPITTNVGGIGEHIINNENGILIDDNNEEEIVKKFTESIIVLIKDREKLERISKNAFLYAYSNFQISQFNAQYKRLLINKV